MHRKPERWFKALTVICTAQPSVAGQGTMGTVYAITTGELAATVINFNGTDGANPFSGRWFKAPMAASTAHQFWRRQSPWGTVLQVFNGSNDHRAAQLCLSDGSPSQGGIIQGSDGDFYGTTLNDGANGSGTVFKITGGGAFTVLHSFTRTETEGGNPYAPLVQASNGKFYGTTWDGEASITERSTKSIRADRFSTVYIFCLANPNTCTDGYNPEGALVEGSDGNLYGMTARGGDPACGLNGYTGCGTIFKITPGGTLTTIHDFEGTDGAGPVSSLIQGTEWKFYGTTQWDGANLTCPQGCGTVFSVTPSGTLTTLYSFCSVTGCTDGAAPDLSTAAGYQRDFLWRHGPGRDRRGWNDLQRVDWPGAVCENKSEGWRCGKVHQYSGDGSYGHDQRYFQWSAGYVYGSRGYVHYGHRAGGSHYWPGSGSYSERHAHQQCSFPSTALIAGRLRMLKSRPRGAAVLSGVLSKR